MFVRKNWNVLVLLVTWTIAIGSVVKVDHRLLGTVLSLMLMSMSMFLVFLYQ